MVLGENGTGLNDVCDVSVVPPVGNNNKRTFAPKSLKTRASKQKA